MSGDLYAQPGIVNQVHRDQDDKETRVNIYVSAESLRVYDNPWVEVTSPNTPPAEAHHQAVEKRNRIKTDSVFLGLLCLLLLAVIICLVVQMNKDQTNWRKDRDQFAANISNLRKINAKLTADNADKMALLTTGESFENPNPRKCKNLEDS